MGGCGNFEGSSVGDDGVDDVFVSVVLGACVVVDAGVGGFGAFFDVVGASALVGCGEGVEWFAVGGVVGGADV